MAAGNCSFFMLCVLFGSSLFAKEKLPETKFITDDVSSTLGGYYLALKKLKEY